MNRLIHFARRALHRLALVGALAGLPGCTVPTAGPPPDCTRPQAPLSVQGAQIQDRHGCPVRWHGVNWFGAESAEFVVGGLDRQPLVRLAATIRAGNTSGRLFQIIGLGEFIVQRLGADPQFLGCLELIPLMAFQSCFNRLHFQFAQRDRFVEARPLGASSQWWQIRRANRQFVTNDRGMLDHIGEFAYIAWP